MTEFASVADLEGTDPVKQPGATAESVASFGYNAMLKGELRAINEGRLRFMLNWIVPWLPRRTMLGMVRKMQAK